MYIPYPKQQKIIKLVNQIMNKTIKTEKKSMKKISIATEKNEWTFHATNDNNVNKKCQKKSIM